MNLAWGGVVVELELPEAVEGGRPEPTLDGGEAAGVGVPGEREAARAAAARRSSGEAAATRASRFFFSNTQESCVSLY